MTDYSKWIGTDARKLPDGSVAVVEYQGLNKAFVRMSCGERLFSVDGKLGRYTEDTDQEQATVIAIIKLGEERPTDFTQVPAFEAWEDGNTLHWKDDGAMCFALREDGLPQANWPSEPEKYLIEEHMHRVGTITGVLVDGKPWPFKD